MNGLSPKSWSEIKPHYRFFKEVLQQREKAEIEVMYGAEIPLARFDPFMINEAVEYLNLSMTNLLAYKRLVCDKYLAWGKVTLYYSPVLCNSFFPDNIRWLVQIQRKSSAFCVLIKIFT
jgi:hypothetical protein